MTTVIDGTAGITFPNTGVFTNALGSIGANGYQKLPNGLIIQWGSASANTTGVGVTFPIAFTTACYCVQANNTNQTNPPAPSCSSISTTGFTATVSSGSPGFTWLAIGK